MAADDGTVTDQSLVDPTSPESGGLPPTSSSGQTTGTGTVGALPISAPTSPAGPAIGTGTSDLLPASGAPSSQIPSGGGTSTGAVAPDVASSLASTPATPTTATGDRVQKTSTGAVTPRQATQSISASSTAPDAYLQSILPLLQTAGGAGTQYVTEQMDPSGAVQFSTSATDPGLQAFDQAAATTVVDPTTGLMTGGTGLAGQFDPYSSARDPYMQQYWGQGDKTMTVDQIRAALSDPAWQTYNEIISQYPDLAGQIVNPDFLAQAVAGQAGGMVDPESNLPKFEAQIQDLLLNQPALVAARGGNYVDITQDPTVQSEIAGGESAAQANLDYMNKYGGGRPWQLEAGGAATDILTDPLVESALAFYTGPAGAELGAALDIGTTAGTAAAGAGVGAAESGAHGGNPLVGALTGAAGGVLGSEIGSALPTGGTPGEYGAATFGGGAGAGDVGSSFATGATSSAPSLTPAQQALGPELAGGIGAAPTASAAGLTPAASAMGASLAGAAPVAAAGTPGAVGATYNPVDVMSMSAGPGDVSAAGPADVAGPVDAGGTPGIDAGAAAIQAGGVDPFDITAPNLGAGADYLPSTDMTDMFASDYATNLASSTMDVGGNMIDTNTGFDYSDELSNYQYGGDYTTDQPAEDPYQFPPNAAGAGRGVTDPTGDYNEMLRAKGLAPPGYGDTSIPQGGGGTADWMKGLKLFGEGLGVASPILAYLGYNKNQKQLQNLTDQLKQSTAPLGNEGNSLLDMYNKGQLPPGQQAAIDQWLQSTKAQIKQSYVNAGMSDSSAELAAEAYAGQTATSMTGTQLDALLKEAQSLIQGGAQGQQAAVNAQLQGDQQLMGLIQNFMNSYGGILRGLA